MRNTLPPSCLVLSIFIGIVAALTSSGATDETISPLVYVVIAIDTEPARPLPWQYEQQLDFSCFERTGKAPRVSEVMDDSWRHGFADSFGNNPKFTWFIMSHELFRYSEGNNPGIVYDIMREYQAKIERFGDELGWHYHHADWFDASANGKACWNQIITFDGRTYTHGTDSELAESQLNYLLAEKEFLPTSFRAGWTWENTDFSNWLEGIIPYDFSAYPPQSSKASGREPLRNIYDWSHAPRSFAGYHPNFDDYQKKGRMRRFIFRTMSSVEDREIKRVLIEARDSGPAILCYAGHTYDNLRSDIGLLLSHLQVLADSMAIPIRFATATEAGAALAGHHSNTSIDLSIEVIGDTISVLATGDIFQRTPYCISIDRDGNFDRIRLLQAGMNRWQFIAGDNKIIKIVCGVSSFSGKTAIARASAM